VSIFFRFQMDRVALLCVVLAVANAGQPLAVPQSLLVSKTALPEAVATKSSVPSQSASDDWVLTQRKVVFPVKLATRGS